MTVNSAYLQNQTSLGEKKAFWKNSSSVVMSGVGKDDRSWPAHGE